jgi:hypothetical protein
MWRRGAYALLLAVALTRHVSAQRAYSRDHTTAACRDPF